MPGFSMLAPDLTRKLFEAGIGGDAVAASRLQARALGLTKIHTARPGVPAMKAALSTRGLSSRHVSSPLRAYDDDETARVATILADWARDAEDGQ